MEFWCFQVCTKTLRNFTVSLRRCSYLQHIFHLAVQSVATIKREVLEEKIAFRAKKNHKILGFCCLQVCTKTLCNFTVSLLRCSYLQNNRSFSSAGCCNNKKWSFTGKKFVSVKKIVKKMGSWCLQVCTKTLRNFTVWLRWCSKSQDGHPSRWAGRCNNKRG